jgi:hypothetical protein
MSTRRGILPDSDLGIVDELDGADLLVGRDALGDVVDDLLG